MRTLIVPLLLFVVCAGAGLAEDRTPPAVTIDELFADPWSFDEKRVRVTGYFDQSRQLFCSVPAPLTYNTMIPPYCVWITRLVRAGGDDFKGYAEITAIVRVNLCKRHSELCVGQFMARENDPRDPDYQKATKAAGEAGVDWPAYNPNPELTLYVEQAGAEGPSVSAGRVN